MKPINPYGESNQNLCNQINDLTTLYQKAVTNTKPIRPRTYTKEIHPNTSLNETSPVAADHHQIYTKDSTKILPKTALNYLDSKRYKNKQNSVMAELVSQKNDLKTNKNVPKIVSKQLKLPQRINTVIARPVQKPSKATPSKEAFSSTVIKKQEINKNLSLYFRKKEIEQKYTYLRPPSAVSIATSSDRYYTPGRTEVDVDIETIPNTDKLRIPSRHNTLPLETRRPSSTAKVVYSLPTPKSYADEKKDEIFAEKSQIKRRSPNRSSPADKFYECHNNSEKYSTEKDGTEKDDKQIEEISKKIQSKCRVNTYWKFLSPKPVQKETKLTEDNKIIIPDVNVDLLKPKINNLSIATSTTTFRRYILYTPVNTILIRAII